MREFSVNGVMQASLLQRLQRGAALSGPGADKPGGIGGSMDSREKHPATRGARRATRLSFSGKAPAGPPKKPSLTSLLALGALAIAAAVGRRAGGRLARGGGLRAWCWRCAALAIGWRFGENGRVALEDEIESRTSELKRALSELEIAQAETVQRLSMAVEFRDEDTGAHIERIGRFSVAAGRAHRHGRGVLRAPASRRAAARRRQGGDPRRDPAEARPADRPRSARSSRRTPRRGTGSCAGPPPRSSTWRRRSR